MTTPLRAARPANARTAIAAHLAGRCDYPDDVAREVVDELVRLGWSWPGAVDGDEIPQPSYSTVEGRARARALFEASRREIVEGTK